MTSKGGNSGIFYHVQEGYDASTNFRISNFDDDGWEEINNAKLKIGKKGELWNA